MAKSRLGHESSCNPKGNWQIVYLFYILIIILSGPSGVSKGREEVWQEDLGRRNHVPSSAIP
jgi:hypothetical protein